MSGIKVTRENPATPLPTALEAPGSVSGEDVDWPTGPDTPLPLDGLSDVDAPTPSDGDVLTWDDGAGEWIAAPATGGSGFELNTEGGQSVIKAHGSMGSTETIDPTDGNVHTGTLNASVTYTLNAPVGSGAAEIEFQRTGSGGPWTETWPGSVTWLGGSAPTPPTSGNSGIVILRSLDGGTTWLGIPVGGGSGASAIEILDDGVSLTTTPTSIDFTGSGVAASAVGDDVTVHVGIWSPLMVEDGATGLWYVTVTGDGDAVLVEV